MGSVWPLVGRQEELAFIASTLARPDSGGVIIAGAAGVGKTRLVAEATAMADSKGFPTASTIGTTAAASIPFGALAHLLPGTLPPAPGWGNVLREAADAVIETSGNSRLVLGVDDAHLLDGHSAALLHHLIMRGEAFLLLALRTGEPAPDVLTELWKDGPCERLELQHLSREETGELVEAALGSQMQATTAHRLWKLTRGNPLFLRELVLGALEEGSLTRTRGVWRWTGFEMSYPRLLEVLGLRLGTLEDNEREALEVSALGEPLELGILRSLVGWEVVDRLERRSLLEENRQQRRVKVRPSHPLYGEILRSGVSPSRTAAIHRRLADALEGTGARRAEDLLRLATWRLEAGATDRPALFLEAAQQALSLFDYTLGRRLAEAATQAGAGSQASDVLAKALIGEGRFHEAEDLLAGVMAETEDDAQRTHIAITRADNLHLDLGRADKAIEILERTEAAVTDPGLRDELTAARAHHLLSVGRFEQALEAGRQVLERPAASARAVTAAVGAAGFVLAYTGRPQESWELLDRNLDRVRLELPELLPYGPTAIVVYRTITSTFTGRLRDAAAEADQAHREALERGPDWVSGLIGGLLGVILRAQGKVQSASRLLSQAVVLLREANVGGQLPGFLAELAHSLALQGDHAGAEEALREAENTRLRGARFLEGWIRLPRAWIAVARGEVSQAAAQAIETAEELGSMNLRSQQAVALHDAARLGEADTVAEPLLQLSEYCDGRLIPTLARHAQALVTRDAPALEQISEGFEEMGAFLVAAEAAAEASRLYEEAGTGREATAAANRAAEMAAMCEGARTPTLANLLEPLPLTSREREVASLAVRGLSNQEIAQRLFVSIRTVGNHLHNVYIKLGIRGRDELRGIRELTDGVASWPQEDVGFKQE